MELWGEAASSGFADSVSALRGRICPTCGVTVENELGKPVAAGA